MRVLAVVESFADRLRRVRLVAGFKQETLATATGLSKSYISRLEGGYIVNPSGPRIQRIAATLGVSLSYLLTGADMPGMSVMREARPAYEIARELEAVLREAPIMVEVLAQPVSAGAGAPEVESIPFWPKPGERNHHFKAVEVVGECMEPRIMRGHFVIVDLTAEPHHGDVVVAQNHDEYLVKVLETHNGDLYLVAVQGREPVKVTEHTRLIGVVKGAHYVP